MIEWIIAGGVLFGSLFGQDKPRPREEHPLDRLIREARSRANGSSSPPPPDPAKSIDTSAGPFVAPKAAPAADPARTAPAPAADTARDSSPTAEGQVSTTQLARSLGFASGKPLFAELQHRCLIRHVDGQYVLTAEGARWGSYARAADGGRYIVWNGRGLTEQLAGFLSASSTAPTFRLYHMTHITNCASILRTGLMSHRSAPKYRDISNSGVNAHRGAITAQGGLSLHDYVPLYFNPRNAMLYQVQQEHPQQIVILEVSALVCRQDGVLYSEGNAAASDSRIVSTLAAANAFDWPRIRCENWVEGRIRNLDTKRMMMSECLVPRRIAPEHIVGLHTPDAATRIRLVSALPSTRRPDLCVSPHLFFPPPARMH